MLFYTPPQKTCTMINLQQAQGFFRKEFKLHDDYIAVADQSLLHRSTYQLDYLDLGLRHYVHTDYSNRRWEFLTLLLASVSLIVIASVPIFGVRLGFGIAALVLSSIYAYLRVQREPSMIYLSGGKQELSFIDEPEKNAPVHTFLKELTRRIRAAYRAEYLKPEEDLSKEERREIIDWLHDIKVINRSERKVMVAELEYNYGNRIGFWPR